MATSSSPSLPTTTKAWTYSARGLPRSALSLTPSHPLPPFPPSPTPSEEWLLIHISYAALNPGEVINMALVPTLMRSAPARTATVPGADFTGVVLDVWTPTSSSPSTPTPDTVESRFQKNDPVIGFITFSHALSTGVGALQEYIVLPAKYVVKLPEGKNLKEAAGLLLTGCTALQQVEETSLKPGQRVLVNGASGGIGTAAVQIARAAVGREGVVVGVCSGRNAAVVKGLGVDEVIDYTQYKDLAGELTRRYGGEKFDVILDAYGSQPLLNYCAGFLKEEGVYDAAGAAYDGYGFWPLFMAGMVLLWNKVRPQSAWLGGTGRKYVAVSMMDPGVELMERVAKMFGDGKLRVVVDSEWRFEEALGAYEKLIGKHACGKVVLEVGGD